MDKGARHAGGTAREALKRSSGSRPLRPGVAIEGGLGFFAARPVFIAFAGDGPGFIGRAEIVSGLAFQNP